MATFTGTNGNNTMVGTATGDTFNPLLGKDSVDGAGGSDLLNINYSTIVRNVSFGGNYCSDGIANWIYFYNVEKFNITTGSGSDHLQGAGLADTLNSGAGNDTLLGGGGLDVINGGAGIDTWSENYSALTSVVNIALSNVAVNGTTTAAVTIGANAGSTVHNIEALSIQTGSKNDIISTAPFAYDDYIVTNAGADSINIGTGGRDYVHGGDGTDLGIFNWEASDSDITGSTYYDDYADDQGRYVNFDAIERFNLTGGAGNDYLAGDIYSDILNGNAGNDTLESGRGVDTVDGDTGVDLWKANYDTSTGAINIQLSASLNINGIKGGISGGIVRNVEHLEFTSGSGNDFISTAPFSYNDNVWTNTGSDTINVGKGGRDYVHGGDGVDLGLFDWSASTTNITVDPYYDDYSDSQGRFVNFDAIERFNLKGGSGNDYLAGDIYNDTLVSGAGRDTLNSVSGIDLVDGGSNVDLWKANYSGSNNDINITLAGLNVNAIKIGIGAGAVAKNIERLDMTTGTGDDVISTSLFAYTDSIWTNDGDDTINIGKGGHDYVHGGNGTDLGIFNWSGSTTAIVGDAYYDDYQDAEGHYVNFDAVERFNLTGGSGNDYLAGDAYADILSGGNGADTLDGFGGNDILIGGAGNDIFAFKAGNGDDRIQDFAEGGASGDAVQFNYTPFPDFATLKSNMHQSGSNVVLELSDTDSITLVGTTVGSFVASDFYW